MDQIFKVVASGFSKVDLWGLNGVAEPKPFAEDGSSISKVGVPISLGVLSSWVWAIFKRG